MAGGFGFGGIESRGYRGYSVSQPMRSEGDFSAAMLALHKDLDVTDRKLPAARPHKKKGRAGLEGEQAVDE
jgi:hypothetical protein